MLTFFFPFLILLFSFTSLFLVGNLILRFMNYDKNNYCYVISPLIGLTFFSIIITFLYNFLEQEINTIRYFILTCIILSIILSLKDIKKILKDFNKILILISPILIIFVFTLFFFNENFYIFRGNYWDNFTMLSMSLIFESFKESTLNGLLLNENFQLESFKGFYNNLKESSFSKIHYNFSFQNIFNLNNVLLFVMLLFPLYKYGIYNNGIGRIDSFPSILDKNQKLEINWSLKLNQLDSCKEIYIDSNDIIKKGYLSLKLDYYDFNENNDSLNSDCAVFKNKNKFAIRKIR